jgi:hypothetical protein
MARRSTPGMAIMGARAAPTLRVEAPKAMARPFAPYSGSAEIRYSAFKVSVGSILGPKALLKIGMI